MKLNIGAGGRRIPGYTGVDAVERPAADIIAKADSIPLEDGCVEEIFACHVWEHFYRWECEGVIAEWWRLLKPGGCLIMEMPNLIKCCQNVLDGRDKGGKIEGQLSYFGLYGDPRQKDEFMSHRWGWTPATLTEFLRGAGFIKIKETPTQWHPAGRMHRDMRIECVKPLNE